MGEPMDFDPIDDGPIQKNFPNNPPPASPNVSSIGNNHNVNAVEDPKNAVQMLRSDDLSNRVAAAHKLDTIAKALGEQRTREVRC